MRPKLPKGPIVIEDNDDDSESSSTDSDESEVRTNKTMVNLVPSFRDL